ncbi:MAG TPA: hypothetical protein VFR84_12050 [Candidatus Angelobacter sp.]|nr:hypothetical protein [Candidatus Angelobacter sp.]
MNRRDILKAIATLPFASTLAYSRESQKAPSQSKDDRAHTLQILLEGPFALVLQKGKTDRLTAFVPRAEERDLAHDFYFNDPTTPKAPLLKESTGYVFQLSEAGLRKECDPYINPGLADFTAETEKWHLAERVVTLELPFPNSINFTGKPLHVRFATGERAGRMATNFVLEYYLEHPEVTLNCPQLEGRCSPSPNCPPGIIRYFFGVAPRYKGDSQEHAREFFNSVLLHKFFPDLERRYSISYIEPSFQHQNQGPPAGTAKPTKAVFDPSFNHPNLLRVGAVLDCDLGGITVSTSAGPTG